MRPSATWTGPSVRAPDTPSKTAALMIDSVLIAATSGRSRSPVITSLRYRIDVRDVIAR